MRKSLLFLAILLFAIVIATSAWAAGIGENNGQVDQLRVMSKNLYIGANILGVNEPRPCGALQSVHELFEDIKASKPRERMGAIVDEIIQKQPHVIGLQEVSRISIQVPSNSFVFDPNIPGFKFANYEENLDESITFITDAEEVVFDYLVLLKAALAARGLEYIEVEDAIAYESDFEFPSWNLVLNPDLGCVPADGALPTDVRAEDRDVILVRSDIATANGTAAQYSELLPFTIPTGTGSPDVKIISVRGYGATDLTYQGRTYRFVNTHLEVDDQSDPNSIINYIQATQAQELIDDLYWEDLPLVVVGDFNSSPDPLDVTDSYEDIVAAGYTDIWTQFGGRSGYTCCQADDLMNFESALSKRIDLIFVRPSAYSEFLPSPAWVTGDQQSDKTAFGLWNSDHAGVAAKLTIQH
jgi:endonuclease/exonuclease/phosphatase family metal-dependent hydrolase